MACRFADFGQGAAAGEGVGDKGMAAVVDGQRAAALGAEDLAGGEEALAEGVAGEGFFTRGALAGGDEEGASALGRTFRPPGGQVQ